MIANGSNEFLYAEGDILLMRRALDEKSCLIAMNFSPKESGTCTLPGTPVIGADIETGQDSAELRDDELALPPYSIVILEENRTS